MADKEVTIRLLCENCFGLNTKKVKNKTYLRAKDFEQISQENGFSFVSVRSVSVVRFRVGRRVLFCFETSSSLGVFILTRAEMALEVL
jgi:hypothetical protein